METQFGTYIIGEFVGYIEKPWPTDATKLNRRIRLVTGRYLDDFGQEQLQTQEVDIQLEDVGTIKHLEADLKGKQVVIPAVFRARKGGRDGAFLSCFMPKGATISFLHNFNRQNLKAAS